MTKQYAPLKITSMWTYRLVTAATPDIAAFGSSLQVYSKKTNEWVHMAFYNPLLIEAVSNKWREVMRFEARYPQHIDFSFNAMIEVARTLYYQYNAPIAQLLAEVCENLGVTVEVLDIPKEQRGGRIVMDSGCIDLELDEHGHLHAKPVIKE